MTLTEHRKTLFWRLVDQRGAEECWPWKGCVSWGGYGLFNVEVGGKLRNRNASRVAWAATNGAIPDGVGVLHRCDNRFCCNPAHLFLGTARDNARDMVRKGRSLSQRGDRNHGRKLCFDDVKEIRARYARGGVTQEFLAALYSINASNVSTIINRRSWDY